MNYVLVEVVRNIKTAVAEINFDTNLSGKLLW